MKNFIKMTATLLVVATISFSTSSCEGDSDTLDNGTTPNNQEDLVLNAPCHYKVVLLDTEYEQDALSGTRSCTVGYSGSNDPNTGINVRIPEAGLVDLDMGYGLTILRGSISYDVTQSSIPSNEDFEGLFQVGDYNFSMEAEEGFEITFMDDDGVEWSSSNPDNLASSNWLKITDSVSGERVGHFYSTIKAEFSCLVTNADGEGRGLSGSMTMSFANE